MTLSETVDDVRKAILACKKRNVTVLPPSINKSKTGFEIVDNSIVFGLSAIKGVGKALSNNIIKNRPKAGYTSFGHFIVRNISILNKKVIEAYTKAGVFSEFGYSKNTILSSIDNILDFMSEFKSCKNNLLDILSIDTGYFIEACLMDYSDKPDSVYYECDAIGMYITKHPMEEYVVDNKVLMSIDKIKAYDEDVEEFRVKTVGVVSGIEIRKTKMKANMCTFLYTDKSSSIPVTIFPSVYNKFIDEIEEGKIVYIDGFVKYDNGNRVLYPRSLSLHTNESIGLMRKLSSDVVLPKKTEEELVIHKVGKLQFKLEKINER
jgi:DNA polymerase-3 subunit alpha